MINKGETAKLLEGIDSIFNSMFRIYEKFKLKDFKDLCEKQIEFSERVLPKRTKVLGTQFIKDFRLERDERLLIIKSHLYLELFINEILNNEVKNFQQLEKLGIINTFYKKVKYLESQELIEAKESNTLLVINSIRNKFAHNIYYSLKQFDLLDFDFIKQEHSYLGTLRVGTYKHNVNKQIIKDILLWLIVRLNKRYRYLHLIDVNNN